MDNNLVNRIEIPNRGNFYLSGKFSFDKIKDYQFDIAVLNKTIQDLPILPDLASRLNEELIKRSIHGTAALEGNPLSEEKVSEILSAPDKIQSMERNEKEIINLKDAYEFVSNVGDVRLGAMWPMWHEDGYIPVPFCLHLDRRHFE